MLSVGLLYVKYEGTCTTFLGTQIVNWNNCWPLKISIFCLQCLFIGSSLIVMQTLEKPVLAIYMV